MDFSSYLVSKGMYPDKKDYTTCYCYHCGKCLGSCLERLFPPISPLPDGTVVEKVFDKVGYDSALRAFYEHAREKEALFKKDLFEDLGIQDNPKRELLFYKAYERGHSGGFEEIYNAALNLVELIQ